ncbi:polyphosphate kinase 1 [Stieleria marina]|uniref:polyphosphate kinase 1 n=1 Tax=Stieleria marina TaxID=1930275 RepID=UPI003AF354A7
MLDQPLPDDRFINREISWLEFNQRVLEQAADESLPLLERAKFLAITSSNMDEFVMVRVGGLRMQYQRNAQQRDPAGLTIAEQLNAVLGKAQMIVSQQYRLVRDTLEPALDQEGISRIDLNSCSDRCTVAAETRFRTDISAVLSPQQISVGHPFPLLQGLGVQLCVRLKADEDTELGGKPAEEGDLPWQFAIVPLGRVLDRMVPMPSDGGYRYVLLEDLVTHFVSEFFPNREVLECIPLRVTRNADIELREDSAADLLGGMEEVLESRRYSGAVRLEYGAHASDEMVAFLSESLGLTNQHLFAIDGPLDLTYLFSLHGLDGFEALKDEAWPPQPSPQIDASEKMFTTIAAGDVILVHPYERYDPVVRLIEEAAIDPDVLAIKQVLYRTSKKSPIVAALKRAADRGKYVTTIVELKARFDEARNIEWAREMEHAGVQVIYGIRGLKTHAKVCIVVRREPQGIVRYVHFGTGNYNEATANLYGDISLLTCDDILGADATTFFNAVTGASQPLQMQQLIAAPIGLRKRLLDLIAAERQRCLQGQKGQITAKLNALVDTELIDALYRASQAGVKIRLNIRGVCCLRPGVEGLSENIEVISIVDRFLEHARIVLFHHGGAEELLISSADWMPRNLDRRIELLVPIVEEKCRRKLIAVLNRYFDDTHSAWQMLPNGKYELVQAEGEPLRSQWELYQWLAEKMDAAQQSRRTTFQTHEPRRSDDETDR